MSRRENNRGFTLVELMVALALSLFLIGGLLLTYGSGRAAALESERLSRLQENVRFASDFLIRDVRNAAFRDQLTLSFDQYQEIGSSYARYGDDGDQSELIIRYAGRGACGRAFADDGAQKIIENRYFVLLDDNGIGDLMCEGTEIPSDTPSVSVPLASGLTEANFQFIMPAGVPATTVCNFLDEDDLLDACIGVRIQLTFAGEIDQQVELMAAFRNVIIDRVYRR